MEMLVKKVLRTVNLGDNDVGCNDILFIAI